MPKPISAPPAEKPAKKAAPKAPAAPKRIVAKHGEHVNRIIHYPDYEVIPCIGEKALTDQKACELLGWLTEAEWQARVKTDAKWTGEIVRLEMLDADGKPYELVCEVRKSPNGEKYICENNSNNRPFDEGWCLAKAQDLLMGQWKFNGSGAIAVSKFGDINDGQHRLTALVYAAQIWAMRVATHESRKHWPLHPPTMEVLVSRGCEADAETKRTYDNTRPRTIADTIYTSDMFANRLPSEKEELAKVVEKCTDMLWKRTEAEKISQGEKYLTQAAAGDFLERHPKIKRCSLHIWEENRPGGEKGKKTTRKVSLLSLSPGLAACVLYLQGSSASDVNAYRNPREGMPRETLLDWSYMDKAEEFWVDLCGAAKPLKVARNYLIDHLTVPAEDQGTGINYRRLEVLARAWDVYRGGGAVEAADVEMSAENGRLVLDPDDGLLYLAEHTGFGGIDCPPAGHEVGEGEAEATQEEVEAARKAEDERLHAETQAKLAAAKPKPQAESIGDEADRLAKERVERMKRDALKAAQDRAAAKKAGTDGKPPAPALKATPQASSGKVGQKKPSPKVLSKPAQPDPDVAVEE